MERYVSVGGGRGKGEELMNEGRKGEWMYVARMGSK